MFLRVKLWLMIWVVKNLKGYNNISTKLLYAQAWHETGDFKSEVFKENNNLFGMRHPSKRKTYSKGSSLGHAVFESHYDSIRDYFERQKYFSITDTTDTDYMAQTVASNYAEDVNYLPKWKNVYSKIKMPVSNLWLYLGIFFLVLIALIMLIFKRKK